MSFHFPRRPLVRVATLVAAIGMTGLTAVGAFAQTVDERYAASSDRSPDVAARERCRHLSNQAPFVPGPGNGRLTATAPARPSPQQACVRDSLRAARSQGLLAGGHGVAGEVTGTN